MKWEVPIGKQIIGPSEQRRLLAIYEKEDTGIRLVERRIPNEVEDSFERIVEISTREDAMGERIWTVGDSQDMQEILDFVLLREAEERRKK